MHRLFLFKAFQLFLVTYPHTVVLETLIDNVKLKFFYLSVLRNYYAYAYSFFDNISHTFCEKTATHSCLVCFRRSLLLTTCSVIVKTSSKIWLFFFGIFLSNFLAFSEQNLERPNSRQTLLKCVKYMNHNFCVGLFMVEVWHGTG